MALLCLSEELRRGKEAHDFEKERKRASCRRFPQANTTITIETAVHFSTGLLIVIVMSQIETSLTIETDFRRVEMELERKESRL